MDARMIVSIIVDAIPPCIAPTVAFKQVLEHGCGIERNRQTNHAFVNHKRPFGMIGKEAVILESVSLRLALAQEHLRIFRPLPAGGFLGDAFDILQKTHRMVLSGVLAGSIRTFSCAAGFQGLPNRNGSWP